jgi:transporter family protein
VGAGYRPTNERAMTAVYAAAPPVSLGVATGLSWRAYFRALQLAPASRVAPIDKLSLALTIGLAAVFLGESVSWKPALGAAPMMVGALLTLAA